MTAHIRVFESQRAKRDHCTIQDIPDQRGWIESSTGANSGTAYEPASAQARKGAAVIVARRSMDRDRRTARMIWREA